MRHLRLATILLITLLGPLAASSRDWGSWEAFGSTNISIRFAQVNSTTCTWTFRNDSNHILKSLNFRIDDINAESGQAEHSTDLIPYSLRPGAINRRVGCILSRCQLWDRPHHKHLDRMAVTKEFGPYWARISENETRHPLLRPLTRGRRPERRPPLQRFTVRGSATALALRRCRPSRDDLREPGCPSAGRYPGSSRDAG
jgi:hypothetical protein